MLRILTLGLTFLLSINIFASDIDYNEINALKNEAINASIKYQDEASFFSKNSGKKIAKAISTEKEFLENQKQLLNSSMNHNSSLTHKYKTNLLVFISFSMPDEAIKELLNDSEKYNASLIIQGLKDDSFDKTFKKITSLVQKAGNIGGIQIDPTLFEKYKVQEVPTYVLKEEEADSSKYDVLTGATGIGHALSIFKEQGEVKI